MSSQGVLKLSVIEGALEAHHFLVKGKHFLSLYCNLTLEVLDLVLTCDEVAWVRLHLILYKVDLMLFFCHQSLPCMLTRGRLNQNT